MLKMRPHKRVNRERLFERINIFNNNFPVMLNRRKKFVSDNAGKNSSKLGLNLT